MGDERLGCIPIKVVAPDAGLTGNAWALLLELAELVQRYIEQGECAAIDLGALPLTPADVDWLRERLGSGQVRASIEAGFVSEGRTEIEETACPGVWWVTHLNAQGGVLTRQLEICAVPDLLRADLEDTKFGCEYLKGMISELG